MELVCPGSCSELREYSGGTAVLTRKCVDLNCTLLDRIWIGGQVKTPWRIPLVTSSPSITYWLLFCPWPLALASTCSSVEKLSTPDAGLPEELVPKPET